jgi:hypothetical protein
MMPLVVRATSTSYPTLKKKLRRNTLTLNGVFTTYYAVTGGDVGAISALVGAGASMAYLYALSRNVDTLDFTKSGVLVPLAVALVERATPYEFNYEATLVTFLSYQLAICSLLYDEVRDIMLDK